MSSEGKTLGKTYSRRVFKGDARNVITRRRISRRFRLGLPTNRRQYFINVRSVLINGKKAETYLFILNQSSPLYILIYYI